MKIKAEDITENGLDIVLSEDAGRLSNLAEGLDFSFGAPVECSLSFNRAGADVFVSGNITTRLHLLCSRCLNEYDQDYNSDFTVFYSKNREDASEKELKTAELDVSYIIDGELDTDEIILSQVTLDVPMKTLCKDDCKGLCPTCGADLNQGACSCPREGRIDKRFEGLKGFKIKGNS